MNVLITYLNNIFTGLSFRFSSYGGSNSWRSHFPGRVDLPMGKIRRAGPEGDNDPVGEVCHEDREHHCAGEQRVPAAARHGRQVGKQCKKIVVKLF